MLKTDVEIDTSNFRDGYSIYMDLSPVAGLGTQLNTAEIIMKEREELTLAQNATLIP